MPSNVLSRRPTQFSTTRVTAESFHLASRTRKDFDAAAHEQQAASTESARGEIPTAFGCRTPLA